MYDSLNPFVRVACEVSSYNFEKKRKVGADHRLFYVNGGTAELKIEGSGHMMTAGTLVYIPADSDYEFNFPDPEQELLLTVINFDFDSKRSDVRTTIYPTLFEDYSGEKLYTGYVPEGFEEHILISEGESLGADMQMLRRLFFNKELHYRVISSAVLKMLLMKIVAKTHIDENPDPALGIVAYIKEHYGEKLLAKNLGELFNYHPNHVNRLVKLATGRGFKDFVIFYRLKVARDMLLSTSESVTAISEACGFTSASYFAELFTREMGMSPREYRKSVRLSIV